jgi:hypothetical protein
MPVDRKASYQFRFVGIGMGSPCGNVAGAGSANVPTNDNWHPGDGQWAAGCGRRDILLRMSRWTNGKPKWNLNGVQDLFGPTSISDLNGNKLLSRELDFLNARTLQQPNLINTGSVMRSNDSHDTTNNVSVVKVWKFRKQISNSDVGSRCNHHGFVRNRDEMTTTNHQ